MHPKGRCIASLCKPCDAKKDPEDRFVYLSHDTESINF